MKNSAINVLNSFFAVMLSVMFSYPIGIFYDGNVSSLAGGFIGDQTFWGPIVGFPLALIFFFPLLFAAFGTGNWRKWMWWALALPVAFEVIFDFSHLFLPIALGLGGYWLGILVRKISNKN